MKKAQDVTLTDKNLAISIVGKNQTTKMLSDEEIESYLNKGMKID
jgi:hypothetical protein